MKITRLRLTGFKSFVEPTDLLIEPGLTGVVGPNGCGKSNLLEAIRWVMGESSAKSMRSSGMEDVIFAGTNGRPARNSAEVLIGLDNAERRAPSQFNESEALEVVRRIERDAGSAYRVNGREVRQRDVQLLFADASTGAHSPALVKQGQINEIINMKPKARRAILEEAAGISGLHSRRHEAELRLKGAETNLERLSDVIQEVEAQLAALKKQARQATRYRNISGDIRRAEALALHLRWSAAIGQLQAARAKLEEVGGEHNEIAEQAARLTTEREAKAGVLPEKRDAQAHAAAGLQRLNHELESLKAEEARAQKRAEELKAHLAQLRGDLTREEALAGDAEEARARLAEEQATLERETEGQEDARAAARTNAEAAAARVDAAETALDTEVETLRAREAERNSFMRTLEDLTRRLERVGKELAEMSAERARIAPSAEDEGKLAAAQARLDNATQSQERLEADAVAAEEARQAAETGERSAREVLQNADRELGILKAEAEAIGRLLQIDKSDLWPPMIDAIKVEPGLEVALGAAIGDDLSAPADEAAPAHWHALAPFDPVPSLPAGARALADMVDGPAVLQRRLTQIGLVDSVEAGTALQSELKPGQRLVTRDGDLWRWDGYRASSQVSTPAAQRLEQRNRLSELEVNIEAAEATAGEARHAYHVARMQAEAAREAEMLARKRVREAQSEVNAARQDAQVIERTATQMATRIAALDANERRVAADEAEARRLKSEAEAELSALGDDTGRRERVAAMRTELQAERTALAEANAALQSAEREAALRADRLQRVKAEIESWVKRGEGATSQRTAFAERITATEAELAAAADQPEEIERKRLAVFDMIAEAEKTRDIAADALTTAENELRDAERELRATEEKLSELREVRARLEAQGEAAEARAEEVAHEIRDVLGCAPEQALGESGVKDPDNLPELESVEARLERYRRERENLGGVNLRADEEATEAQTRLDGLFADKADLEGAIHKLRSAISSLNREGRERILAAFDTVNGHFEKLFTTLFEGGAAKLELVESDDPLEAGLEIMARPPGKRPATLSLLSGGEQTLTALALIFAVFLSNPAPICVLDEVDAPLDDANVDRYCTLLGQMANATDTRFIVITHHPVTMSRMDRLYGVTMAERGVSQLVSVDLTAATALRAAD